MGAESDRLIELADLAQWNMLERQLGRALGDPPLKKRSKPSVDGDEVDNPGQPSPDDEDEDMVKLAIAGVISKMKAARAAGRPVEKFNKTLRRLKAALYNRGANRGGDDDTEIYDDGESRTRTADLYDQDDIEPAYPWSTEGVSPIKKGYDQDDVREHDQMNHWSWDANYAPNDGAHQDYIKGEPVYRNRWSQGKPISGAAEVRRARQEGDDRGWDHSKLRVREKLFYLREARAEMNAATTFTDWLKAKARYEAIDRDSLTGSWS